MSTKTLALSGTLAALLLYAGVGDTLSSPNATTAVSPTRLTQLDRTLQIKQAELRQTERQAEQLTELRKQSLPADATAAQIAYQQFLVELTESVGLKTAAIETSQPAEKEGLGQVLHFSIRGTGTTSQIGRLLDAFQQADVLHQLTEVTLYNAAGPQSKSRTFRIEIETLALEGNPSDQAPARLSKFPKHDMTDLFAARDLFAPLPVPAARPASTSTLGGLMGMFSTVSKQQPDAKPRTNTVVEKKPASPPPQPKRKFQLVGVIGAGGQLRAIFHETTQGDRKVVSAQDSLLPDVAESQIIEIRSNSILLNSDQGPQVLALGDTYIEPSPSR